MREYTIIQEQKVIICINDQMVSKLSSMRKKAAIVYVSDEQIQMLQYGVLQIVKKDGKIKEAMEFVRNRKLANSGDQVCVYDVNGQPSITELK